VDGTKSDVTHLLQQWQRGDPGAMDRLLPLVYDELRRVARARLRSERDTHTLQATALVHEAYLRLVGAGRPTAQNRAHFFAIAARLMRQILVDHARRRRARKRGGGETAISLPEWVRTPEIDVVDLLALDQALVELTAMDPRLTQVVELRFFAGLTIEETSEALKVSAVTVERDWMVAKAWLHERLSRAPDDGKDDD
jgi:RNA polymerase sigma factor (TIGR02999 family)